MSIIQGEIGAEGALVCVRVGVPAVRAAALSRNGFDVPAPVFLQAQIDTGATTSGVHAAVFAQLGLSGEIDNIPIRTSSTGEEPHAADVYLCDLNLVSLEGDLPFRALRVLAHTFGEDEEARAVIGRDVLSRCRLEWDGPAGRFVLAY